MAPVIEFPLDTTGASPVNKVTGEIHDLPNRKFRVFCLQAGAFFAQSLAVVDVATGLPLTGLQCYASERLDMPTVQTAKNVCLVVVITDPNVSNRVSVDYQAVGGIFAVSGQSVVDQVNAMPDVERPQNWLPILRRAQDWPQTDLEYDTIGRQSFENLVSQLQRLNITIVQGDEVGHEYIRKYVRAEVERLGGNAQIAMQNLMEAHLTDNAAHDQYVRTSEIQDNVEFVRRPKNTIPTDGATGVMYNNVTFGGDTYRSLYAVAHTGFQLQIATSEDFAANSIVLDRTLGAVTSTVVTNSLIQATRYYWRIRYCNAENVWSRWSAHSTFMTNTSYVAAPSFVNPAAGAIVGTATPTLELSAFSAVGSIDSHVSTDWEIWTGANGTGTLVWASTNNGTNKVSIQVPSGLIQTNSTYHVRARHTGASLGASAWSANRSFSTPASFIPSVYGTAFQGGFYAGQITYGGRTYAIIVAPKATGEFTGALSASGEQVSAYSDTDSVANTAALKVYGGYANTIDALSTGGYSDWQVPARNVMAVISNNLKPSLTTIADAFKIGGMEALSNSYYWTSTAYDYVRDDSYYDQGPPIYGTVEEPYSTGKSKRLVGAEQPSCAAGESISDVEYEGSYYDNNGVYNSFYTWTCNGVRTKQVIVGYEQGEYHEVYRGIYAAHSQNPATGTVGYDGRTTVFKLRAVRLVDMATIS